jgi:hypothetical protein
LCELLKRDGTCAAQGAYVREYWKHSGVAVLVPQSPLVIVPSRSLREVAAVLAPLLPALLLPVTVLMFARSDWNRLGGFFVDSVEPAFMGQPFDRVEVESQRENEAQISQAIYPRRVPPVRHQGI